MPEKKEILLKISLEVVRYMSIVEVCLLTLYPVLAPAHHTAVIDQLWSDSASIN